MLPDLLRAEDVAVEQPQRAGGSFGRAKACIVCFLFGAPAHQDIWDLKPEAPVEVRGPFQPIASSVPGLQLSEHIPRTAQMADQFALIRSVTHPDATHTVAMHYMMTGHRHRRPATNPTNLPDDFPCFGAVANRLLRGSSTLPPGISLNAPGNEIPSGHIFPGFFAGFLGTAFDPMFITDNPASRRFEPLPIARDQQPERWRDRRALIQQLDRWRAAVEVSESIRTSDLYREKALHLMSSPAALDAFDLAREPAERRERFGSTPFGQGCLLARRLVEAGVRLVTVNWARDYQAVVADHWDTHRDNFALHRDRLLPAFDQGYTALLTDLRERGLLDETLVVVLGEFGRTPTINKQAGRDHWPGCFSITLAGAGIRGGAVYGASDRIAAYPVENPVGPEDVAATIYHALGIPQRTELVDLTGRPIRLWSGKPLTQLFG